MNKIDLMHLPHDKKYNILQTILSSEKKHDRGTIYPEYPIRFYFKDSNKWIAVDNSCYSCYVEEFNTSEEAESYLLNDSYPIH